MPTLPSTSLSQGVSSGSQTDPIRIFLPAPPCHPNLVTSLHKLKSDITVGSHLNKKKNLILVFSWNIETKYILDTQYATVGQKPAGLILYSTLLLWPHSHQWYGRKMSAFECWGAHCDIIYLGMTRSAIGLETLTHIFLTQQFTL